MGRGDIDRLVATNNRHDPRFFLFGLLAIAISWWFLTRAGSFVLLPGFAPLRTEQLQASGWPSNIFLGGVSISRILDRKLDAYFSLLAAVFSVNYFLEPELKKKFLTVAYFSVVAVLFGWRAVGQLSLCLLGVYVLTIGIRGVSFPRISLSVKRRLSLITSASSAIGVVLLVSAGIHKGDTDHAGYEIFVWQLPRILLFIYESTYDQIEESIGIFDFLVVFCTLADFSAWVIAQGYRYTHAKFLSRDKNAILTSGAGILLLGTAYPILGGLGVLGGNYLVGRFLGPENAISIQGLFDRFAVSPASVPPVALWAASFLYIFKLYGTFAGMCHIKVGVWRLLGFDIESHFRFPFASTNFIELWGRYAFHFREVVLKLFYFPMFLKLSGLPFEVRNQAAMIWAIGGVFVLSLLRLFIKGGLNYSNLQLHFRILPYFVALYAGIVLTQKLRLRYLTPRKPWTLDWLLPVDLVSCFLTIQAFAWMHIFVALSFKATYAEIGHFSLRALGLNPE